MITPNGSFPLAGTTWTVQNQTMTTEHIPTWAVVMMILLVALCLLGLLFLLIKEQRMQGFMTVTVQGPGAYDATQIPVTRHAQVADIEARVHYIRSLAAHH